MSAAHPPIYAGTQSEPTAASGAAVRSSMRGVPWYLWVGVVAVSSASFGGQWDVAWHRSIGRDTFWTPAHMAIYACGVLAGVVGIYLVSLATWGKSAKAATLREASVSIFGLRAPLGVFLAGWGGLAMLTSAPFDNWWHNAYGLDVKVVSPPHTLLILGLGLIDLGILFLIVSEMNRAASAGAANHKTLQWMFLYVGALILTGRMFFIMEFTWDVLLHRVIAYAALALSVPVVFAVIAQASRYKWAATTIAALYMAYIIGLILLFPLFPAQPKLGPVYYPVTHLVPPKFPILLIVPAIGLDLLWQRTSKWKWWQTALVSGVLFTALIFAVEWPFANFLLSKASENRFFGTIYFDYLSRPESYERTRRFFAPASGLALWVGLARASLYASVSTAAGLLFGRWMRGVQR
jgi:hypothetical protein